MHATLSPRPANEDLPVTDFDALADDLTERLRAAGSPERAAAERRYLRSELEHLGTGVPAVRKAARDALRRHGIADHDDVVALALALWRRPVHERRLAAVEVLVARPAVLAADDLPLAERFLREARTWALVDPLAIGVVGGIVAADDATGAVLDRWASDPDPWLRRAAVLALLRPLRAGEGDWDRFARYADALLDDSDPFIRKALGWVLREVGRNRPELVVAWLGARTPRASGVTVREAVRHLPEPQRTRLLRAHRERRALA